MKPVEMKVALAAVPRLTPGFFNSGGYPSSNMDLRQWEHVDKASDLLAEAAGRICYNSFHLPNEKTAENKDYLNNIKNQMHYTVLEHASFTFYLGNVSRALLAELTRHRHHSFSVRSQRYCDERDSDWVVPPLMQEHCSPELIDWYNESAKAARDLYQAIQGEVTKSMREQGVSEFKARKAANDAARYALPEGTVTELYVTSNGNGWLSFLTKRDNPAAAEEIRIMAGRMSEELKKASPHIFQ